MISSKGNHKLKMIRPSYNLGDHIMGLSLMLNNIKSFKSVKESIKIFNSKNIKSIFGIQNRLIYSFRKFLPLQKINKLYGQN